MPPRVPIDTVTQQQLGLQAGLLLCLLLLDQEQVRRKRVIYQKRCHIQLILVRSLSS